MKKILFTVYCLNWIFKIVLFLHYSKRNVYMCTCITAIYNLITKIFCAHICIRIDTITENRLNAQQGK